MGGSRLESERGHCRLGSVRWGSRLESETRRWGSRLARGREHFNQVGGRVRNNFSGVLGQKSAHNQFCVVISKKCTANIF